MTRQEMYWLITEVIDEARAGVLATVDSSGKPHMRWMTPGCLSSHWGVLYMVSATSLSKISHVRDHPDVELMLQTKAVETIITVRGKLNILENPSIRTEVLECVGPRLQAFWKFQKDPSELVVLELVVEEATLYLPMKGTKETVDFKS